MKKREDRIFSLLMTLLIVSTILIAYIHQMSPSPILTEIGKTYDILDSDVLMNMSISIMFPMLVIGSIVGGSIEKKIGTFMLFNLSLSLMVVGLLMNFIASNYTIFLVGRSVYGLGFGLSIPFIGSAIMRWYAPAERDIMTTINSFFPSAGALLSFLIIAPQYKACGSKVTVTFGIWGVVIAIMLVLWVGVVRNPDRMFMFSEETEEEEATGNVYFEILKRGTIRLLCVMFFCDFTVYSYVATILPTLLYEISDMSLVVANVWAALAFPLTGVIGSVAGGVINNKLGLRKPTLIAGQVLKLSGTCIAVLGANISIYVLIFGIGLFGLASGLWLPAFFGIPTELPGMSATMVGASFALMSACGFVMGFVAPTIGGFLTSFFMNSAPNIEMAHVFGLKWSLFALGSVNLISTICSFKVPETGVNRAAS